MDEFQFVDRSFRNMLDLWKIFSRGYFKKQSIPLADGLCFSFTGTQNKKSWSVKKICLGHIFSGCGATGCAAKSIMAK